MGNITDGLTDYFHKHGHGYGLDFGTFRSSMAYHDASIHSLKTAQYENISIQNGIPSLFWYNPDNQKEYLCDEVIDRNGLSDDPAGVCSSIKMKLDIPSITLHNKIFSSEYIAEQELKRILSLSHDAFSKECIPTDYSRLVVGVPVRFGARLRQILKNILVKAANGKEIRLLSEPIAAAIAYSYHTNKELQKVLVYDLGAGTFDAVFLLPNKHRTKTEPYPYRAVYPDGINIAGDYFDMQTANLIINTLTKNNTNLDISKLTDSHCADYHKLMISARNIKENLSARDSYSAFIEGTNLSGTPVCCKVTITRQDFEKAIEPALSKTIACAWNILKKAHAETDRNVHILLTGGSTYIPLVRKLIEEKFSHLDSSHILQRFPEQAVALGCAIYGCTAVTDTPVAYGYAIGSFSIARNKEVLDVLIPSNAPLPYKFTKTYFTRKPLQDKIHFMLFEVEDAKEKALLNTDEGNPTPIFITHQFGKKIPERTPVELTVELSKDGILTFTIIDNITPIDVQHVNLHPETKEIFI